MAVNTGPEGRKPVQVYKYSDDPTKAWKCLRVSRTVDSVEPMSLDTPVTDDCVRFVCVSDTHAHTHDLHLPPGDVLLHAGDFTNVGQVGEVREFNTWLGLQPYKAKVVIAGNHELTFDPITNNRLSSTDQTDDEVQDARHLLTNCTYLQDSAVVLFGLKIWGSPWQPEFRGWAFNLERGQKCLEKWNLIPDDTDILITHGPPLGHGDTCIGGVRAGCVELLNTIEQRVKPLYHVFGHIHEGYGVTTNGCTHFVNACTCNVNYQATQPPIVFDVQLPAGRTKSSFSDPTAGTLGCI